MGISEGTSWFFLDVFTHWWSTEEVPLAKWTERTFTSIWWDYSLRNPAWNLKNSCKMYILLYNQFCFNIKIKWLPLTPLKALSNIYIEARHPVFILWLCLPGMLPLPTGLCISRFESSIISCMWIWIRKKSLCSKSGHVEFSLSSEINYLLANF